MLAITYVQENDENNESKSRLMGHTKKTLKKNKFF